MDKTTTDPEFAVSADNEIRTDLISDKEFAKRVLLSFTLFSDILPIYNKEQRMMFRLIFQQDLTELIPSFFLDLARFMVKIESRAYLM